MRKPIVGISMKIYKNYPDELINYVERLMEEKSILDEIDVFILPSMGTLYPIANIINNSSLMYGAQNIAPEAKGALTGEYSVESLCNIGGTVVEIGHAERRQIFNEDDEMIAKKVKLACEYNMTTLLCIGEDQKLQINERKELLKKQLKSNLNLVEENHLNKIVIAYEPVWAIGKDEAASTNYIHSSHKIIREILYELFQEESYSIRIIYGGSVSAQNSARILDNKDTDGVFVGRFGHNVDNFIEILEQTYSIKGG